MVLKLQWITQGHHSGTLSTCTGHKLSYIKILSCVGFESETK